MGAKPAPKGFHCARFHGSRARANRRAARRRTRAKLANLTRGPFSRHPRPDAGTGWDPRHWRDRRGAGSLPRSPLPSTRHRSPRTQPARAHRAPARLAGLKTASRRIAEGEVQLPPGNSRIKEKAGQDFRSLARPDDSYWLVDIDRHDKRPRSRRLRGVA